MTQEWRPVVGYEGLYEVSDQGNVRSLDRVVYSKDGKSRRLSGKMLTQSPRDRWGHRVVTLSFQNRAATRQVHHLVLNAFVSVRPSGLECRHLDGDASNNRLENLAWGTSFENKQDLIKHGTHHYARRMECEFGHPLSGDNLLTRRDGSGGRRCRQCKNRRERERYARERGAA